MTVIQLKRSLAGNAPASLADGEMMLDMKNGLLWWKDAGGALHNVPLNLNVPSGLALLDSTGKVPTANLPASTVGGMNYQGTWNANTNTPALTSGQGTKGFYYKVNVAGTTNLDGNSAWTVGDFAAFDGTTWDKFAGTDTGVLAAAATDIWTGTDNSKFVSSATLANSGAFNVIADAATISWNMALGFNAQVTLGGNRTFGPPTNYIVGRTYILLVKQDGTGSRTISWDTSFKFGAAGVPTLSTGANAMDLISMVCDTTAPTFRCSVLKGF